MKWIHVPNQCNEVEWHQTWLKVTSHYSPSTPPLLRVLCVHPETCIWFCWLWHIYGIVEEIELLRLVKSAQWSLVTPKLIEIYLAYSVASPTTRSYVMCSPSVWRVTRLILAYWRRRRLSYSISPNEVEWHQTWLQVTSRSPSPPLLRVPMWCVHTVCGRWPGWSWHTGV